MIHPSAQFVVHRSGTASIETPVTNLGKIEVHNQASLYLPNSLVQDASADAAANPSISLLNGVIYGDLHLIGGSRSRLQGA